MILKTTLVRSSATLLVALGFSFAAGAQSAPQTPPPPAPKAPASRPTQTDPQRPTFRTSVNLVTADVIPRDGKGQFVANLKRDDFIVLEDGVAQEVASFTLVHGGRYYNLLAPPPAPVAEGIILPPARPTNDAAGRIFILFVDDLHLDFRNTGRIRDLFKKISETLIHEGDMFGIVSTGPSSIAIDMTYDRKRLDDALKKISGAGLRPTEIMEGGEGAEGPTEVRYRAHVAFSTAYDLVRELGKVQDRRKALIYVSNGYDFDPFPKGRLKHQAERLGSIYDGMDPEDPAAVFNRQGQQFADADLVRELAELTRACNRSNVTIYSIDPRGLVGMPDLDENVDMNEFSDYVRKSQDSLRVLADETGGIAVVNQNDFDKALKRIDGETSDYYMIGYYSSNPDPTRKTRRIEVKVKRDGINVWSRRSYTLKPNEVSSR